MASNQLSGINNALSNAAFGSGGLGQAAAQQQTGLMNQQSPPIYTTMGSVVSVSYGPGYITYPAQSVVWQQPPEPTKAEQWVFQKAVLRAELKNFCDGLFLKSIVLALWTNIAYSLFTLLCGTKISAGTTWMIFGLIPLMALAAKQRILAWGERFLG